MRYRVHIKKSPDLWTIRYFAGETELAPRTLNRQRTLPYPLEEEQNRLTVPEIDAFWDLPFHEYLDRIHKRDLTANVSGVPLLVIVGRYLFLTLFGERWKELHDKHPNPSRIELFWEEAEDPSISLPCEMMHNGQHFLATDPKYALYRALRPEHPSTIREDPLRLLFVVGCDPDDSRIRPGLEYLGVLRTFQAQYPLRSRLLLKASTQQMTETVAEFRPTIVHFVCHGVIDPQDRTASLELVDEQANRTTNLTADALMELLEYEEEGHKRYPSAVVLNSCNTAKSEQGDSGEIVCWPFAAQLVSKGIPVVLGMAGRVSDQACRLFARYFYEQLAQGKDVLEAAAVGRRLGLNPPTDLENSTDWAMPTIYLDANLEPGTNGPTWQVDATHRDWHLLASRYEVSENSPPFCGRMPFWKLYADLMESVRVQRSIDSSGRCPFQFLVIRTKGSKSTTKSGEQGIQFGHNRLLKEYAIRAILDGHVPCLVRIPTEENPLGSADDLVALLGHSLEECRELLGLDYQTVNTLQWYHQPKGTVLDPHPSEEILDIYRGKQMDPSSGAFRARVLREDFVQFLNQVRDHLGGEHPCRLVLLLDEAQRFGEEGLRWLVKVFFGPMGLRARSVLDDVRVVMTLEIDKAHSAGFDCIRDWVENNAEVQQVTLGSFGEDPRSQALSPLGYRLAYEHCLLHWRQGGELKRTVVHSSHHKDEVFEEIHDFIDGIPSNLALQIPKILKAYSRPRRGRHPYLVPADDEDRLNSLAEVP